MDHTVEGLVALLLSILTGIEESLGGALENTGLTPNAEAVVWTVIILLCLAVAIKLLNGWIRTVSLVLLVVLAVHALVTHGFGTIA